jgi:hypothetical protein
VREKKRLSCDCQSRTRIRSRSRACRSSEVKSFFSNNLSICSTLSHDQLLENEEVKRLLRCIQTFE